MASKRLIVYTARKEAEREARRRWGPWGFAMHFGGNYEVGKWLAPPAVIGSHREIWGVGSSWDEAFADAEKEK